MSKRLGSTPFRELLANSLQNDELMEACASALDDVLAKVNRAIPHLLIFARLAHDSGFINPVPMLPPMERLADLEGGLAELPPELLDLLAWQLHVESYDKGVNLQAKREMLQSSLLLHRRNGTPWSVRHALETLLRVPAKIPEWFSYGGEPYFFRVILDVSGVTVDINWIISALRIIFDYKNVRSWLEYLRTVSENPCQFSIASANISRTAISSRLWLYPKNPPKLFITTACAAAEKTTFYPACQEPPKPVPTYSTFSMSTVIFTRSVTCPTNL